ncbi:MAG: T9SS type A sorting domain-containing protein [Ignavibacteriae bacterium]|nr:T9SS type A sorting domain-containing protein [Ignavibacteriota bacterium]
MKHKIKSTLSVFCILLLMMQVAHAQTIPHSVISAGATNAKSGNTSIRGTVTQTSIGRIAAGNTRHNVGFWYAASNSLSNGGTLVVIPQAEGTTGQKIKVPLLLQQSKNLITTTFPRRSFEATIRYNATVLESVNLPCNRTGDICTLKVIGTTGDTAGILGEMEFIPKLGNAEKTTLEIVSFVWKDAPTIKTVTKNGEVRILNVCREGDSVRLVRSVAATMLAAYPNPASSHLDIDYTLGENGNTTIEMIDMQGRVVSTLKSGNAKAGSFKDRINLMYVPNGSYFLRMQTPNELFTKQITVQK